MLIKVIRRTDPRNNSSRCLFYILHILPLHFSALGDRLQAEYTIILGSYLTQRIRCFVIPPEDG
jgi:hypothetical protein